MLLLDSVVHAGAGDFLLKILVNALVLMGGAYLLRGVTIQSFGTALLLAVVLALLNATVGSILDFVTAPINFITLGLFSLVIDAFIIKIADWFLTGFRVKGFLWALLLAAIVAIANALLHLG